jgi:hypothetical protein
MSAVNDLTSAGELVESISKLQLVSINQLQVYFGKNNLLQIYESGALYDCTIRVGRDKDLNFKVCMVSQSNYFLSFYIATIFACKNNNVCNCIHTPENPHRMYPQTLPSINKSLINAFMKSL